MRHHTHGLSGDYLANAHKTHASYRDFLLDEWLRVEGTQPRRFRGMTDEAEPATDMRLFRFLFEVLVWDGSKNKGLTPNTLKQYLTDNDVPGIAEKRVPMPCTQKRKLNHGGHTHQTLPGVSAYKFINSLMNQHQGLAYKGNMSILKAGHTLRPYLETAAALECLPLGKQNPPLTPPAIVWLVSLPASGKSYLQEDLCLYLQARGEHEQLITHRQLQELNVQVHLVYSEPSDAHWAPTSRQPTRTLHISWLRVVAAVTLHVLPPVSGRRDARQFCKVACRRHVQLAE